ncbi:MAG: NAD(P)/FAD-dependent oxidoreductase [Myxococcales bacterium]|nr:NAD(P)/FAD-dependent oxidoreductase [Myxococcales bacterium]
MRGPIDERYDAIIIGAGVGGLTCASLLAAAGRRVLVLEQHYVAGGNATLFRRGRWAFDVGLHYIGDAHPGGTIDRILRACGVEELELRPMCPELERVRYPDFEFSIPHSREAYRARLHAQFPADRDRRGVDRYMGFLEQCDRVALADQSGDPLRRALAIARAPRLLRNLNSTAGEVLDRCTDNPRLRAVFTAQHGTYAISPRRVSAILHAGLQNHYFRSGGWYPAGGGQALSDALADELEARGGAIRLRALVERVHVERGRVTGVTLRHVHHGVRRVDAPLVICNADVRRAATTLFDPAQLPSGMTRALTRLAGYEMALPLFVVFLGLSIPPAELPYPNSNLWLNDRYDIDADYRALQRGELPSPPSIYISTASLKDPHNAAIAPPGHSNLEIMTVVPSAPAFWGLEPAHDGVDPEYRKRARYLEIKQQLTEACVDQAARLIPGLKQRIVYREAATPLSHSRYTRSTAGSAYGFAATPAQFLHNRPGPRTPVAGLMLCGTNCRAGHGIVGGMVSGLQAADAALGGGLQRRVLA